MKNKGFVSLLTIVVTLLCLYYLSFTFVARGVEKDATEYATDADGEVSLEKRQAYLDSVWNKPVYSFLGLRDFTYKEVKGSAISLGLDLQGGMHVTLEVSPIDIIRSLSDNNQDSAFLNALHKARIQKRNSQQSFSSLFYEAFKEENPDRRLAPLFANAVTIGRISLNDSDGEVMSVLNAEIESAIDRSLTILTNRIDQFGTSQPNIQRLGTGRIQVEIPGAENPARVRKLLQGVAKLEFWDVVEPNAIQESLMSINQFLVAEQKLKNDAIIPDAEEAEQEESLEEALSPQPTETDSLSELEKTLQSAADSALQGLDSLQNLNVSPLFALSSPPGSFRYALTDTTVINNVFDREEVKDRLPRNVGVFWGNKPDRFNRADPGEEPKLQLYFLDLGRNHKAKLTGEAIVNARTDLDQQGQPAVSMNMNTTGTRIWAKWTAEAATNRSRIAIMLDILSFRPLT